MTFVAPIALAGLFVLPVVAFAQTPCVGVGLELPMPRATAVEWRSADVPSTRFPGVWQQGFLDGFGYRIFPDQTAMVVEASGKSEWRIEIQCSENDVTCVQTAIGPVPEAASAVATAIGECLVPPPVIVEQASPLSNSPSSVVPFGPEPAKDSMVDGAGEIATDSDAVPAPVENAPPANDVSVPAIASAKAEPAQAQALICAQPSEQDFGSAIRAVQRLLQESGRDPGPIDGVRGRRTIEALTAVLGPDAAKMDPVSVLIALVAQGCAGTQEK